MNLMNKEKNLMVMMIIYYMKVNITMEKKMELEENMMMKVN